MVSAAVTGAPSTAAPARASATAAPASAATPASNPEVTESALPQSPTGSAYFGCGVPIPTERLWDETTESQALEAISVAKACAAQHGRRLLLEFVAPWCKDCREMARLDETPIVTQQLRSRFERVRINVGQWDRHEGLRRSYEVRALATYVVINPKTSQLLVKTTLEPITKKGKKLTPAQWASWLGSH
jgi:thiol-disulfide isomerase/thioredoxin